MYVSITDFPMLDVAPVSDSSHARMPLDFTPYLLSASPPSTGLDFLSYAFSPRLPSFVPQESVHGTFKSPHCIKSVYGNKCLNSRRKGPLKSIIIKSESQSDLSSEPGSDGESSPTSPTSPGRMRKRVSFADNIGMALATVRIMSEPSDQPPCLPPGILESITHGAEAGVTEKPPLKLTFPQPASDYLAFRDKLQRNVVSLENVILKDYTVAGTIKVKNVSFEKKVLVRYTYDSWETHVDVSGTFIPGPGDSGGKGNEYDTFTFEFEVPPACDMSKSIQFAVCYEANNTQYWDNNEGNNYGIIVEDFQDSPPLHSLLNNSNNTNNNMKFGPTSLMTGYADWHTGNSSLPYW